METKLNQQLSYNFNLSEFTRTSVKLPNVPTNVEIKALSELVTNVLQPARDELRGQIRINSGFRTKEINKMVGGVWNSQHLTGEASDITSDNNLELFRILVKNDCFDQIIIYLGAGNRIDFIHVSYSSSKNRKQIIIK